MIFLGRFLLAAFRQGTFSLAVLVYLVCIWYSHSSSTLASFSLHWFILLCWEIHCEQGYLGTAVPFCGPDFQCILRANLRINPSSWCWCLGEFTNLTNVKDTWWLSGMVFQSLRFQPLWMCSQGGVTKWWPFVQKLGVGNVERRFVPWNGGFSWGFLFHTLFVDFLKCQLWWKKNTGSLCGANCTQWMCLCMGSQDSGLKWAGLGNNHFQSKQPLSHLVDVNANIWRTEESHGRQKWWIEKTNPELAGNFSNLRIFNRFHRFRGGKNTLRTRRKNLF